MWLLNLGFAGGQAAQTYTIPTLIVEAENTTLHVKDVPEMLTVYKDSDAAAKKKVAVKWADWLGDASISTATWSSQGSTLTIADESNSSTVATAYVLGGTLNRSYEVYCKIVTDEAIPRTEVRTILVRIVRIAN